MLFGTINRYLFPDSRSGYQMPSQQIEAAIGQLVADYAILLDIMSAIEGQVGTAGDDLLDALGQSLLQQQRAIVEQETFVRSLLHNSAPPSAALCTLMGKWSQLLRTSHTATSQLVETAKGVQAHLGHELETLRKGKTALGSYRHHTGTQGRIINSTL